MLVCLAFRIKQFIVYMEKETYSEDGYPSVPLLFYSVSGVIHVKYTEYVR